MNLDPRVQSVIQQEKKHLDDLKLSEEKEPKTKDIETESYIPYSRPRKRSSSEDLISSFKSYEEDQLLRNAKIIGGITLSKEYALLLSKNKEC